jgi:hypothetical protein
LDGLVFNDLLQKMIAYIYMLGLIMELEILCNGDSGLVVDVKDSGGGDV